MSKKKSNEDKMSKAKNFFNSKFFQCLGIFFLIFVLMTVTYHTRTGAVDFQGSWVCHFKQNFDSDLQCGLTENIKSSILRTIQEQIARDVQQSYPNLNEQFLAQEVQKRYQDVINANTYQGQNLDDIAKIQLENYVRNFQSDDNQTYLTAIDPYYFLGLSTNYYQNGHVGTTLDENGNSIVEYRLAPNGVKHNLDLHSYVLSKLYAFNGVDKENPSFSDRMNAIFTLSAIISTLVVIPLFLLLRNVTNTSFAFIGTLILMTSTIFVSRTQAGFVDTDAYNVLFPILITALLYFGIKFENLITKVSLSILSGVIMVLFLWAWAPAWFYLLFVLLALAVPVGVEMISKITELLNSRKGKKNNKELFNISSLLNEFSTKLVVITFFLTAEILSVFFLGRELLFLIYEGLTSSLGGLTQVSETNMWPNVLSSVAELNSASISTIFSSLFISTAYGQLLTILGLAGTFAYLISNESVEKLIKKYLPEMNIILINLVLFFVSVFYFSFVIYGLGSLTVNNAILFLIILALPVLFALALRVFTTSIKKEIAFFISITLIWFLGGLYMSLNGTRFILLLAPAFTLLLSFGCYMLALEIVKLLQLEFKKINLSKAHLVMSLVICLAIYLVASPQIDRAYGITNSNMPNFDDKWYELMEFTRTNSSEDAIINSWWDFGHFFAAIGERGVTFDGGSQGNPASYWTGHWLMQNDEDVAVDILRMLSCSGNNGYDYIEAKLNDSTNGVHAFNLVNDLMGKTRIKKEEFLRNYSKYSFSESEINDVLDLVHCEEPRQMLAITSGDMISKAGVWAHWGSWSFERKYVHANYNTQSVDEMVNALDLPLEEIQQMVDELKEIDRQVETLNLNRNNLENQWLAPYPSYSQAFECPVIGNQINCQDVFKINLSGEKPSVEGELLQGLDVSRIIVPSPFEFSINELNDKKELDIVVVMNGPNSAQLLPAQYPLGASMFTRLYYFNGLGTSRFDEFRTVNTQTASKVSMWNVDFNESRTSINFEDLIQVNAGNESSIQVSEIEVGENSTSN